MMKHLHLATSILASAFILNSTASAQLGPSSRHGFGGALAHGHALSSASNAASPALLIKKPGQQLGAPVVWNRSQFAEGADYTKQAMFPGLEAFIEIDGHSTGNDDIPLFTFDATVGHWVPQLAQVRWMQLTVSVTNDADGLTGSLIKRRNNLLPPARHSPGSDLIGYYFSESAEIDESLQGATLLEQSSETIGYTGEQDISALDWGVGVLSTQSAESSPLILFTNQNSYYFTITQNSATIINAVIGTSSAIQFAKEYGNQVQANGATIYEMHWNGTAWSQPEVYRAATTLGLHPLNDELDAVAVNPVLGMTIFSTQYKVGFSQLQVHAEGWSSSEPLWDNGNFVAHHIGSTDDSDDIDSVAIIDPGVESPITIHATHLATPLANYLAGASPSQTMGISVTRGRATSESDLDNAGVVDAEAYFVQVSGWGPALAQDGLVTLYLSINYDPAKPLMATWMPAGSVLRTLDNETSYFEVGIPSENDDLPAGHAITFSAVFSNRWGTPCSLSQMGTIAVN